MFLDQIQQIAYTGICSEIQHVTKEEVYALSAEDLSILHSIMIGTHVTLAIAILQRIGFFEDLIPEIQDGINLKNTCQFKEIWPHTIRVIGQTPQNLNLRWAALFHDLGKAMAFRKQKGKITFHHHEHISAGIFDRFARKTRIFSNGQRRAIRFLVANLGYVEGYDRNWSESAIRRFDKEMGVFLDDLLILSEADITTGKPEKKRKILRGIQELKDRIIEIREKDEKKCLLPKGLGTAIADSLGIPLGPRIGEIRKELEDKVNDQKILGNQDIDYYISYLKETQVEKVAV
jgi:poly(A) polymerase